MKKSQQIPKGHYIPTVDFWVTMQFFIINSNNGIKEQWSHIIRVTKIKTNFNAKMSA